jgi:hypothetical protein
LTQRLIVLQPTRGEVSAETQQALANHMDGIRNAGARVTGKPVDEARNELVALVPSIVLAHPEYEEAFVLWVDDDAWWWPGTVTAMMDKLVTLGEDDLLSAWCSKREPYSPAMAFDYDPDTGLGRPALALETAKLGDIVEVDALSAHFLMHRRSLLEKLGANPFDLLDNGDGSKAGEDISFCRRVKAIGGKCSISCVTGTTVLHVDVATGLAYAPNGPPLKIGDDGVMVVTNAAEILAKGAEVVMSNDSAILVKGISDVRSYGENVDNAIAVEPTDDGRESPAIIFTTIPIGKEPGWPVYHDLNGMTRDEAYGSLMNLLNTRALMGFTLMPRADKMKHMATLADMVGTTRNGGPRQVVLNAEVRQ